MKRRWTSIVGVAVVLVLAALLVAGSYTQARRTLTAKDNDLTKAYNVVAGAERHRLAMLPVLVTVLRTSTAEEQTALARMQAESAAIRSAGTSRAEDFAANRKLDDTLGTFLRVEDAQPEKKANNDFEEVASDLVSAQRDLNVDRRRYDRTLADYNTYLDQFPNNFWGKLAGFHLRDEYIEPRSAVRTSEFSR